MSDRATIDVLATVPLLAGRALQKAMFPLLPSELGRDLEREGQRIDAALPVGLELHRVANQPKASAITGICP